MTGIYKECMKAAKKRIMKTMDASFVYEDDEFFVIHDNDEGCFAFCIVDWDKEKMPPELETRQARRCLESLMANAVENGMRIEPSDVSLYHFAFHIFDGCAFMRLCKHAQNEDTRKKEEDANVEQ